MSHKRRIQARWENVVKFIEREGKTPEKAVVGPGQVFIQRVFIN
jgi:hypothetical protein